MHYIFVIIYDWEIFLLQTRGKSYADFFEELAVNTVARTDIVAELGHFLQFDQGQIDVAVHLLGEREFVTAFL